MQISCVRRNFDTTIILLGVSTHAQNCTYFCNALIRSPNIIADIKKSVEIRGLVRKLSSIAPTIAEDAAS